MSCPTVTYQSPGICRNSHVAAKYVLPVLVIQRNPSLVILRNGVTKDLFTPTLMYTDPSLLLRMTP